MTNKKSGLSATCRQPFFKLFSTLFLIMAIILTQVPVPNVEAATSDFRMDGNTLIKYAGKDTSVEIPDTVQIIATEAFADNNTMTTVTIPNSVTKIEKGAFSGCSALKTVTIPDNVKEIGKSAFSDCTSLSSLSIGSGLSKLDSAAFGGCTSLKTAEVSENNVSFQCTDGIIYDRGQKTIYQMLAGRESSDFSMPSSVAHISEYAFWDCKNLKTVSLSSNLKEIPAYAFSNCSGLESVDVPYSVKSISSKAFEDCVKLSKIDIPESVSFIHETAFDGCPLVKDKIKTTPLATANDTDSNSNSNTDKNSAGSSISDNSVSENEIQVNNSVSENDNSEKENTENDTTAKETTDNKNDSTDNTEDTKTIEAPPVKEIDGMATPENKDVIGKTKIIGGQALVLIDHKNSNVITDGVGSHPSGLNENDTSSDGKTLLKESYYRNNDLTSYAISDQIESIEDFSFARSALRKIVIPDTVKSIGYAAFYHCDDLADITIPDTVTNIGGEAFRKTAWMNQWLEGTGNGNYGEETTGDFLIAGDHILIAYKGNTPQVTIPEGVKQIAQNTFKDHSEIKEITFPDSLEKIGKNVFDGCSSLENFEGGNHLQEIDKEAFVNCPIEVTSISVSADRNNYIGNVGTYQILKKKETKNPTLQGLKYGSIAICIGIGICFFGISMKRRNE